MKEYQGVCGRCGEKEKMEPGLSSLRENGESPRESWLGNEALRRGYSVMGAEGEPGVPMGSKEQSSSPTPSRESARGWAV